ncbi:hypothetical protein NPIL_109551 [Nephila pilipes]|uniref:Uncharacterized protein n=1 Tax=Nephila pilipes TaxID=299642 RepID=A0A8X6N613_NEPPI|nr:hypothetical protein NPIL_109551 [Nephila pilipes]
MQVDYKFAVPKSWVTTLPLCGCDLTPIDGYPDHGHGNDDASNPSLEEAEPNTGKSLHFFIKTLNLDAINIEVETAKFSSDILKICLFLDEKLNQLDRIKFNSPHDKSELFKQLSNLLEEARCKFHTLKTKEIALEVSFFKEITQAWGMNTENKNEFKEVKKSKKKSSPIKSQQPKRQKNRRNNRSQKQISSPLFIRRGNAIHPVIGFHSTF